MKILKAIIKSLMRDPDITIGTNYLQRWYVVPRNPWFNIYLHKFFTSDDDRALHDHPWWFASVLLKGEFIEHMLNKRRTIPRFIPFIRGPKHLHHLQLIKGPAWTIIITGPQQRQWGFLTTTGWQHWQTFTQTQQKAQEYLKTKTHKAIRDAYTIIENNADELTFSYRNPRTMKIDNPEIAAQVTHEFKVAKKLRELSRTIQQFLPQADDAKKENQ